MNSRLALGLAGLLLAGCSGYRDLYPLPTNAYAQGFGTHAYVGQFQIFPYDVMRSAGFRWVRTDLNWAVIETSKGAYQFQKYDLMMAQARAANMRMVLILNPSNPLYGGPPKSGEALQAYANFVTAAVRRYKGRGVIWEIWNEPNSALFWPPTPNATDYMTLVKRAVPAIRAVAPEEYIAAPAVNGVDLDFLEACFKQGLLDLVDIVTVHPYRLSPPETIGADFGEVRQLIERYRSPSRKIVLANGEMGFAIASGFFDSETARRYNARFYLEGLEQGIPLNIQFSWKDPTNDPLHPATGTGLYDVANNARAGLYTLQHLQSRLDGYRYAGRLALASSGDHCLLLSNGAAEQLVAWTTASDHTATIPATPGVAYSGFRNTSSTSSAADRSSYTASASGLAVTLTGNPIVLVPSSRDSLLQKSAYVPLPQTIVINDAAGAATALQPVLNGFAKLSALDSSAKLQIVDASLAKRGLAEATKTFVAGDFSGSATYDQVLNAVKEMPMVWDHSVEGRTLEFALSVSGGPTVRQVASVLKVYPMALNPLPALGNTLWAHIDNPSAMAFSGRIRITANGSSADKGVSIPAGVTSQEVQLSTSTAQAAAGYKMELLSDSKPGGGGGISIEPAPNTRLTLLDGFTRYANGQAVPSADYGPYAPNAASTGSTLSLYAVAAPSGLPVSGAMALKLSYSLKGSSTYLMVVPSSALSPVLGGTPQDLTMWVYGDSSGNALLARMTDSGGQVFNTEAVRVNWSGWKLVRLSLDRNFNAWWSGANDGVPHLPARIAATLVLDTSGGVSRSGIVYLAGPSVVARQ